MDQKTILVADDDIALLQALAVRLRSEGFQVELAQDSYQALQRARETKPDLLLLDVDMPAGDGFSVQERLQAMNELSDTPVIYVTGKAPERVNASAHQLGAYAIVYKPFDAATLLSTIREALGLAVRAPEKHGV